MGRPFGSIPLVVSFTSPHCIYDQVRKMHHRQAALLREVESFARKI